MIKFDTIKTSRENMKDFSEHFEEIFCDESATFLSKKEFLHEEDGLTFKYKYSVKVIDLYDYIGESEDEPIVISLELLVSPDSLNKEQSDSIKSLYGFEDEQDYELTYYDVQDSGNGILMATEEIETDRELDFLEEVERTDRLNAIASVYEIIDSMRGFYLDKAWNRIGTNGWDLVHTLVFNEDLFS